MRRLMNAHWIVFMIFSCYSCNAQDTQTPPVAFALFRIVNAHLAKCGLPLEDTILAYDPEPDASGSYELRLSRNGYTATMVRDPRTDDWIALGAIHPDPCSNKVLAVSAELVKQINSQADLGWTAALTDAMRGKTIKPVLDFIPPEIPDVDDTQQRRTLAKTPAIEAFEALEHYDSRDRHAADKPCKAFRPRAQNDECGGDAFFAVATAAAARLCLQSGGRESEGNVVFAPMQARACMDRACDQNVDIEALSSWHVDNGFTEEWCNPYQLINGTAVCRQTCRNGRKFAASRFGASRGEYNMRAEIFMHGPVVVLMTAYNDLSAYKTGVYRPSALATPIGTRAMVAVGWGVADDGTPYWTLQDARGSGWGEDGFIRVRRGMNDGGMESNRFYYITPSVGTPFGTCSCGESSIVLADCTCRCTNPLLTGDSCDRRIEECKNGGVLAPLGDVCLCPFGFFGVHCHYGAEVERYAAVEAMSEANAITAYVIPPPELKNGVYTIFLTLFSVNAAPLDAPVMEGTLLCVPGSCIDDRIQIDMQDGERSLAPGRYTLYMRIATPTHDALSLRPVANYTVLHKEIATQPFLDAAIAENNPLALVHLQLGQVAEEHAHMTARLAAAEHVKRAIQAEYGASELIWPLNANGTFFTDMRNFKVCYKLSFDGTTRSPKRLEFANADGRDIPNLDTWTIPANQAQGCQTVTAKPHLADAKTAMMRVVDASTKLVLLRTPPFIVRRVLLDFVSVRLDIKAKTAILRVQVQTPPSADQTQVYRANDLLRIVDQYKNFVGECSLFPHGLPSKLNTSYRCVVSVTFKAKDAPTRTPLHVQFFANNDRTTPALETTQPSGQIHSLSPYF